MDIDALCTDGVNHYFFRCLARCDRNKNSCAVAVPSTVVFESSTSFEWFYSPEDVDCVKVRDNGEYSVDAVVRSFLSPKTFYEDEKSVVAMTLSLPSKFTVKQPVAAGPCEMDALANFLCKQQVSDFLGDRLKRPAILQHFVQPLGTSNSTIEATWSPSICMVEARRNVHDLRSTRISAQEKCQTFDACGTATTQVTSQTYHRVRLACERVARHLEALDRGVRVTGLSLFFKLDHRHRLYLLFSQSVRVEYAGRASGALNLCTKLFVPDKKPVDHLLISEKQEVQVIHKTTKPQLDSRSRDAPVIRQDQRSPKERGSPPKCRVKSPNSRARSVPTVLPDAKPLRKSSRGLNQPQEYYLSLVEQLVLLASGGETADCQCSQVQSKEGKLTVVMPVPHAIAAAVPDFVLEEVFEPFEGKWTAEGLQCSVDSFVLDVAEELTRSRIQRLLDHVVFDVKQ